MIGIHRQTKLKSMYYASLCKLSLTPLVVVVEGTKINNLPLLLNVGMRKIERALPPPPPPSQGEQTSKYNTYILLASIPIR